MSFGRIALSAAGSVGVAACALAVSVAAAPGVHAQPAAARSSAPTTVQPASHGPTVHATSHRPVGDPGAGNVSVYVPPVPPRPVIIHLCRDLTDGRKPEPAVWLPDLVALTGGTQAATTSWCRTFLSISTGNPHS
jgi:hypothetical protein